MVGFYIPPGPASIRNAAVLELLLAFKSNQCNMLNKRKQKERASGEKVMEFTVQYRIKKHATQTITIQSI